MAHIIITAELRDRHATTKREMIEIHDDGGQVLERIEAFGELPEPGCYDLGPDWDTAETRARELETCAEWRSTEEVLAMLAELKRKYAS